MKGKITTGQFGKVVVLMGGWSAEREISLKSGSAVLAALQAQGIDAQGIDVQRNMIEKLWCSQFDRAFIALHGPMGEDGVIQAALDLFGLPYTGSGVLASSLCMNKLMTKRIWRGTDLSTPDFVVMEAGFDVRTVVDRVGLPLIVKPVLEGSSIGMTKVDKVDQLQDAWQHAIRYGGQVIAERWIRGEEYTVAILGTEALPVIKLDTPRGFYDFEAKYSATDTLYHCPCGLPPSEEAALQSFANRAFTVTGATGWGRVDLMMDTMHQPWLIEINTVPGMTDHSLVPMAAAAAGISFEELVVRILEDTGGSA